MPKRSTMIEPASDGTYTVRIRQGKRIAVDPGRIQAGLEVLQCWHEFTPREREVLFEKYKLTPQYLLDLERILATMPPFYHSTRMMNAAKRKETAREEEEKGRPAEIQPGRTRSNGSPASRPGKEPTSARNRGSNARYT